MATTVQMEMANINLLVWLLGQTIGGGVNWEIILVGVGLVVTLLGIAWKGGLLAGGQANRMEHLIGRIEALESELVSTKAEFHAYRNDLTKVRDMAVISHNDVGYLKGFADSLTQGMKSLERELIRVQSVHER